MGELTGAILAGAVTGGILGGFSEGLRQLFYGEPLNVGRILASVIVGAIVGGVIGGVGYGITKFFKHFQVWKLAQKLANKYGAELNRAQGSGWIFRVTGKKGKEVVIRLMVESNYRTNSYYRISIEGKGSLGFNGKLTPERDLSHMDIVASSYDDIVRLIDSALDLLEKLY